MTSWTTNSRRGCLPEEFAVHLVAVPDHQRLAATESRGPQRAAAAGDQSGQLGVAQAFGLHVDVPERATAGDVEVRGLAGQRHGVTGVDGLGASIGLLADLGIVLGKEPLRFDAAGSPLAVVVPVDTCSHVA